MASLCQLTFYSICLNHNLSNEKKEMVADSTCMDFLTVLNGHRVPRSDNELEIGHTLVCAKAHDVFPAAPSTRQTHSGRWELSSSGCRAPAHDPAWPLVGARKLTAPLERVCVCVRVCLRVCVCTCVNEFPPAEELRFSNRGPI